MMADEIVNTLGFNVTEALEALGRLDTALQAAGKAFGTFGAVLNDFNGRAAAALTTMHGLATAAARLATSMQKMPAAARPAAAPTAAAPTAAAPTSPALWLPPGVASSAQQVATSLANAGQAGSQAGQQIANSMNQAANATKNVNKHGEKLYITWETLVRIMVTQAIVRAMSQMRDALKESVDSAIEFQQNIAEIQTIAPRIGSGAQSIAAPFHALAQEVVNFAKAYNIALPQATSGLYETISDQFTSISDRANVMHAAMMLSRVAVMDFDDAVMLLTGTLNAYGDASGTATTIASKFFTTINLGRVHGKELADVLGQVLPVASELGVTLDEVNSAFIAMTIGGMDAHKTATALRGVMIAFLKPSEDMKKAIRALGFSDPAQLVAAKGFEGALQAIADEADNMGSEIAKSVRNVRALTAELRLTSEQGAKKYQEALKAMQSSTPEALERILKEFRSTDAERLTSQINALKINLTQDFGQALVTILGNIMDVLGGADRLSTALIAVAAAAVPAAVAIGVLSLGLMTLQMSLGPIGIALLALNAILVLSTGLIVGFHLAEINHIRQVAAARQEGALDFVREMDQRIAKWKEVAQTEAQAATNNFEERMSGVRRKYFRELDRLKTENETTVESSRHVMESMIATQERVVMAYRNAANAAVKAVQESTQRQIGLETQYADTRFKQLQRGNNAEEQANDNRRRGLQLAKQASDQLSKAKTPREIESSLAVFQRAAGFAQQADNIAQGTKNIILQHDAEQAVLSVINQQVEAEERLQTLQAQQALQAAAKAAAEQGRVNNMKTLMKAILTDLDAFDKAGPKGSKELKEQGDRLRQNFKLFREQFLGGEKVSVEDFLSFDQFQQRVQTALEGGISEVEVKDFWAAPTAFDNLRRQLEDGFKIKPVEIMIRLSTQFDPQLREEMEDMTAEEKLTHIGKRFGEAQRSRVQFGEVERQAAAAQMELNMFMDAAQRSLEGVRIALCNAEKENHNEEQTSRLWEAALKFVKAEEPDKVKIFEEWQAAYNEYLKVTTPSLADLERLQAFTSAALAAQQQADKLREIQGGVEAGLVPATQNEQRIHDIENALKNATQLQQGVKQGIDETDRSAALLPQALNQVAQTNLTNFTTQIQVAANAMWDLAYAAASVQAPGIGGEVAARYGGMMRRLAAGGAAGTDVVPAMLSPGEFVMNAASTKRFASQLVAMNAGAMPVFRSEGGSVTNIGDINVSVNGGGSSSRQTGRSIAAEIRRELRRGTSVL